MTASEFSFLALGLVLGLVSGAALIEFLRARPPAPPQVRVTVSPDSVPRRRASTLADAYSGPSPEPARGGPADRRMNANGTPAGTSDRRTSVPFDGPNRPPVTEVAPPVKAPQGPPADTTGAAAPPATSVPPARPERPDDPRPPPPRGSSARDPRVGIPISSGEDPTFGALRGGGSVATAVKAPRVPPRSTLSSPGKPAAPPGTAANDDSRRESGAGTAAPADEGGATKSAEAAAVGSASGSAALLAATGLAAQVADGPCAEERRIADERCEVAGRARARAEAAADAVRAAQRNYDSHDSAANAAALIADPRAIQAAKEEAHAGFRAAVATATTRDAHEAAARDWLNEVNRINRDAREAASTMTRERAAAREDGVRLERLALEADAARIAAANADAACVAARSAAADCEELSAPERRSSLIAPVAGAPGRIHVDEDETLGIALEAGGEPLIFRLLKGDRAAMHTMVTELAGDDLDGRRHWQLLLTRLLEAMTAEAIDGSALELPDNHPFWGMFTPAERREIAQALASLGYRFDGLRGWMDDRRPSKRDLSLALGYAGLDPMRIRQWPSEEAMNGLFDGTRVAGAEYIASRAGDLTLAQMVAMLGRRADGLTEVWNAWGRIRPLLLAED